MLVRFLEPNRQDTDFVADVSMLYIRSVSDNSLIIWFVQVIYWKDHFNSDPNVLSVICFPSPIQYVRYYWPA